MLRYPVNLGKTPIKSSYACVLGCCALRGSDRFTPTVSIRQRQPNETLSGAPPIFGAHEQNAAPIDLAATGKLASEMTGHVIAPDASD